MKRDTKSKHHSKFSTKRTLLIASLASSLLLNLLMIIALVWLYVYFNSSSGRIEQVTTAGIIQCSEEFRSDLEKHSPNPDEWIQYFDYICQQNGSEKYFQESLEKYTASLK